MLVNYLKCKIHGATVTQANLHYRGSITIDRKLLKASGMQPFEMVHIYNITNGERFETYVIEGGDGVICLNGAAAWKARPADKVIIVSYCTMNPEEASTYKPKLVFVGDKNEIVEVKENEVAGGI